MKTLLPLLTLLISTHLVSGILPRASPGPKQLPSHGKIWPSPQAQHYYQGSYTLTNNSFKFILDNAAARNCDILKQSLSRFQERTFPQLVTSDNSLETEEKLARDSNFKGSLTSVQIILNDDKGCQEKYPYLDMDEHYEIKINSPDQPGKAQIIANKVWGALRGLESFSQLVYINDDGYYMVNSTSVMDFPRFTHRGVMLDSSRHFLTKKVILANLDLMEMNKYNILHWHITDDQSFPYVSPKFPNLSAQGAYDPKTHVYSQADIAEIIEYARLRGIRVIPEFDTPGHTQSWELGQPGLLTKCYSNGSPNGMKGPIDPTLNSTYKFIDAFFDEISTVFPDKYVHLGGDEVSFDCWKSNPKITTFMKAHNFSLSDYALLESYYIQKLLDIVSDKGREYLVWNEVFDNKDKVKPDTIIHIWTGNAKGLLEAVTKAGLRAILSEGWYLNYISYGSDWTKYYNLDPQDFEGSEDQKKLVIGGEACIWGEYVNSINLLPRLWPRASAVAERLWSSAGTKSGHEAAPRIQEMECRMLRRGYPVEPINGPGFCKYTWN